MQQKAVLTQHEVNLILEAAQRAADANGWRVTIAVVDDGGHPLALRRLDDSPPFSAYVATEKARTSALARRESRDLEESINGGRMALLSVPALQATMTGGVPVRVGGQIVGAVGVSGVMADQDAQVAAAGAAAISA